MIEYVCMYTDNLIRNVLKNGFLCELLFAKCLLHKFSSAFD